MACCHHKMGDEVREGRANLDNEVLVDTIAIGAAGALYR
jgi:hypothetical protein